MKARALNIKGNSPAPVLLPPPGVDRSRPWTASDQRGWSLVLAYEQAVGLKLPGFRLYAFRSRRGSKARDPRDVMAFKQTFRRLGTVAETVEVSGEELITAFVESCSSSPRFRHLVSRPNAMLNIDYVRRMLERWRAHHDGRAATPGQAEVRRDSTVRRMTASDRERARQSVADGYARIEWLVRQGRIDEAAGAMWSRAEPWVEGETVLGPDDQYRDNALEHLRKDYTAPDGTWHRWWLDEDAVKRTHVVRRHRRKWHDSLVGLLLLDGVAMGREFLWGLGRIWPVPDEVAEAVREVWSLARTAAGLDEAPATIWGASELRAWHEEFGQGVLGPDAGSNILTVVEQDANAT